MAGHFLVHTDKAIRLLFKHVPCSGKKFAIYFALLCNTYRSNWSREMVLESTSQLPWVFSVLQR